MPKIEISYKDLCSLVGTQIKKEELADVLLYAKAELDEVEGDKLKLDCKDTNRPDLWCTEGAAREIRARFGKRTISYKINSGKEKIIVDNKSPIQTFAVNMIVRNVKLNENSLSQMIQLQEKLATVLGNNRKDMSIGVYDMSKVKFPVKYTSLPAEKIKFVPLGFAKEMSAEEILSEHPKGKEFGHFLKETDVYPVWVDADNKILSMVPVINSNEAGNVSVTAKDLFIEATGSNIELLKTALNVIAAQVLERGAKVESVVTISGKNKLTTPEIIPKKIKADINYLRGISGMNLSDKEIIKLLENSNYEVKQSKNSLLLTYPGYRNDIMHARDVAEDILITYGYNTIEPVQVKIPAVGRKDELNTFCDKIADIMVGCGLQEILLYSLTNKNNLFGKMNMPEHQVAEIDNPTSENWSVFRTSLLPGLLEFFVSNKHVEYPQNIFEIGKCVFLSGGEFKSIDKKHLAVATSGPTASYDAIAPLLDALMRSLGLKYVLKKSSHASFIEGRCADIICEQTDAKGVVQKSKKLGAIGEIHPLVLNNWNIEKPVAAFELDVTELFYLLD
ncbi:MAG TPA: phenylalanine--tRNA ligase subunit beta [archaeon]|nr:phenylalanine--tRNA ligase subunit beta [archaeon]